MILVKIDKLRNWNRKPKSRIYMFHMEMDFNGKIHYYAVRVGRKHKFEIPKFIWERELVKQAAAK